MLRTKRVAGPLGTMIVAAAFAATAAMAATTSDQPASVLIYPKIVYNTDGPFTDTIIEIANVSTNPVDLHCFYVNATSHCTNTGLPCDSGLDCGGLGQCLAGWAETDFSVTLTENQPFYWTAGVGRNRTCAQEDTCEPLPLIGLGVCSPNGTPFCTSDQDCGGGDCLNNGQSNAGTAVPPVGEDLLFVGELKCVVVDGEGNLQNNNVLIGTATIVSALDGPVDAQSYNAVGVRANSRCDGAPGVVCQDADDCIIDSVNEGPCVPQVTDGRVLVLGPDDNPEAGYQACAETLVLDHIFDGAPDPIGPGFFVTDLTLVPCSEDFSIGTANLGRSTAQFLVFNEFEQRFSTSRPVTCFDEVLLSNIDTSDNTRSVFSVNVSGTIAGQSRIRAVGSGLTGVARAMKSNEDLQGIEDGIALGGLPPVFAPGAGYEIHQQGQRQPVDLIVLP